MMLNDVNLEEKVRGCFGRTSEIAVLESSAISDVSSAICGQYTDQNFTLGTMRGYIGFRDYYKAVAIAERPKLRYLRYCRNDREGSTSVDRLPISRIS